MGGLVKGSERKRSFLSGCPSSSQSRGTQQGMERGRGGKKTEKGVGKKGKRKKKPLRRRRAVLVTSECPWHLCGVGSERCRGMGQEEQVQGQGGG